MPPKRDADDQGGGANKKSRLQQKTAAEFFAENKHFAGFESPGKSLYTSIRELVENSLDAAESIGVLPEVHILLEEISQKSYRQIHNMDTESVKKDKDLYKQGAEAPENEATEGDAKAAKAAPKAKKISSKDMIFYRLTVTDNGCGMKHDEIPKMFGTVLSGTKYGVRQERGKFGLGSKMVLIWSKMSTGLPMAIRSSEGSTRPVTEVELSLDLHTNSPNIFKHTKVDNESKWRGSQIRVTIGGEFSKFKRYTVNYLREMAVITPYARFEMHYVAEDSSKSFHILHARRSECMPPPPSKAKVHPAALDNSVLDNLIGRTQYKTLFNFLKGELDTVTPDFARRMIDEFGSEFSHDMPCSSINGSHIRKMLDKISQFEFDAPSGAVLSPAGEYNLHLGVMKEMRPDMIATSTPDVTVVDGHPVIVEAAVSLGGRRIKEGIQVHRFANRIPMLFQPGNDVSVKTAMTRINWKQYRIDKHNHKIGVFVSVCSTKIPYGGPNKEYIGDEHEDLQKTVRDAIMKCCAQLKSRLARAEALRNQKERRKNLHKYIPYVARSLWLLLDNIAADRPAEGSKDDSELQRLLGLHKDKQVSEELLQHKLKTFVEEADMEQAMSGVQTDDANAPKEDVFLPLLAQSRQFDPELHTNVGVFKLFTGAL